MRIADAYESMQSIIDSDRDGMRDASEQSVGLDPTDPEDRNLDRDGDGYTELEEYLQISASREVGTERQLLAGGAGC